MSVTMSLYKVNPKVSYKGYHLDFLRDSDFVMGEDGKYPYEIKERELGAPLTDRGSVPTISDGEELYNAYEKWEAEQVANAWTDGKTHDKIDMTYLTACFGKGRGWRRIKNRLNTLPIQTFNNGRYSLRYIPVDEVEYAQGWFFKKRFFKKEITFVICVTKQQMENFFKQYIDFNNEDTRGREAVDRFLNAWEDGMVFECSW